MSSNWIAHSEYRALGCHLTKDNRCCRNQPILLFIALCTLLLSGCSITHNGFTAITQNGAWSDTVVVLRNRSISRRAWLRRKHAYCNHRYERDFCAGFRAGYEDIASGADGCTPATPPPEYFSWEFQSAEGQARSQAWFEGYPHGARAAEEDGVAHWNQVPLSAGLQAEYQQAGVLSHEGAVYPIPDSGSGANGEIPLPIQGEVIPFPQSGLSPSEIPSSGVSVQSNGTTD